MKNIPHILKLFIGWPLSLIAFFFIIKTITSQGLSLRIQDINFGLLVLAIICFLLYFFIRTIIWQKILRATGHEVPLREVAFNWEAAEVKRYVPGFVWSFVARTVSFSNKKLNKKTIVSLILYETEAIGTGSIILSLLAIPFITKYIFPNIVDSNIVGYSALFCVVAISCVFIFSKTIIQKVPIKFLKNILPDYSPQTNLLLLIFATSALFFFGAGTYFAITSLTFLTPQLFFELTGFFVFSLLLGYLSFITPSGLGIRDGIITIGLSKLLPLSVAALTAVYVRIVLILSEVIFFILTYLWKNTQNKLIDHVDKFVKNHTHGVIVSGFIAVYILYFTTASFMRFDNFYTGRFDLGNMAQTVWNTTQGNIFELTNPNETQTISRLAFHADFILVLIAPFYLLWSDPRMLLLIQTVVLGLGAYFVYKLSVHILKNKKIALIFSFCYLINPSVGYVNLYDFHAVSLATTFLLTSFYFLLQKKTLLFLLFTLLAVLTKEQLWIISSLFGLLIITLNFKTQYLKKISLLKQFIMSKQTVLGLLLFIGSIMIFVYLVWFAVPDARGAGHFALEYYSDFGDSPTKIVASIITSPQKIASIILQNDRLNYLSQIFGPLGYIPLFAPYVLVFALPDILINLLSKNNNLHQIYYQYTAIITPFLFIAAMYGLLNIKRILLHLTKNTDLILYAILVIMIASSIRIVYLYGPLPGSKSPNIDMFTKPEPNKQIINHYISKIPTEYSVTTTNNLGAHFSHRKNIYTIPIGMEKADVIAFLLGDRFAQPSPVAQREMVQNLKKDLNYRLVIEKGNFALFIKKDLPL